MIVRFYLYSTIKDQGKIRVMAIKKIDIDNFFEKITYLPLNYCYNFIYSLIPDLNIKSISEKQNMAIEQIWTSENCEEKKEEDYFY